MVKQSFVHRAMDREFRGFGVPPTDRQGRAEHWPKAGCKKCYGTGYAGRLLSLNRGRGFVKTDASLACACIAERAV